MTNIARLPHRIRLYLGVADLLLFISRAMVKRGMAHPIVLVGALRCANGLGRAAMAIDRRSRRRRLERLFGVAVGRAA